jgi:molybdopterin converting factor small subunit
METIMNILVFGQLEDITGSSVVSINRAENTELLLKTLYAQYPALAQKKFLIAVDQKIITGKTEIGEQAKVALLPPFSGG